MRDLLSIWLQFFICAGLLAAAGIRLIRYGDALATLTGLSRGWVGLILMGTVTSLPELVTGLSAVTLASSPDIAVGDALGSCVFNLAILALADLFYRHESIYAVASRSHLLSASFGVLLLLTAAMVLLLSAQAVMPALGHVSGGSIAILLLYVMAMRTLYLADRRDATAEPDRTGTMSMKAAMTGYAIAAAAVTGSGIWLPFIGVELAQLMGWSESFMGTLFVALATSVPELATTWGALRIGAVDLALGNLLGSNLFDVLILAIDDFAYLQGPLYLQISEMHNVTALSAALMSSAVAIALVYRPASTVKRVGSWASITLLALYLMNALLQFLHRP